MFYHLGVLKSRSVLVSWDQSGVLAGCVDIVWAGYGTPWPGLDYHKEWGRCAAYKKDSNPRQNSTHSAILVDSATVSPSLFDHSICVICSRLGICEVKKSSRFTSSSSPSFLLSSSSQDSWEPTQARIRDMSQGSFFAHRILQGCLFWHPTPQIIFCFPQGKTAQY